MPDDALTRPQAGRHAGLSWAWPRQLSSENARAAFAGLLIVALVAILRTAWMSDDGLITVRVILNALHGYGPNFNIDERVQAYTHPLWFLCATPLTALLTSPWVALLALSLACTLGTFWLLVFRLGQRSAAGFAACGILLLSKAFLDYCTSGLEPPLTGLLLLATLASGYRRLTTGRQAGITLCLLSFAFLYLNRADTILLLAPFVLVVMVSTFRRWGELLASIAIAAAPVVAWTAFSLVYYGSFVPNTAYAKLGGAIPKIERLLQGCTYFFDSLAHDTVTLPVIGIGFVACLRRDAASLAIALGLAAFLGYVLVIGGDQMSGRFFVAPLLVVAALIARIRALPPRAAAVGAAIAVLAALNLPQTLAADTQMPPGTTADTGIADERAIFYDTLGLMRVTRAYLRLSRWPKHQHVTAVHVLGCGGLGVYGLADGPSTHTIEQCALSDPLLARLPAAPDPHWRIAHLIRPMPPGYLESLQQNRNLIRDPRITRLYDDIRLVTRGPLFTRARFAAILRLALPGDSSGL